MRAFERDQRQGEAIAVYERLADRLANDLGVRPSEPLQRLRLALQSGPTALPERELQPLTTEAPRPEAARRPRGQAPPTSCGPRRLLSISCAVCPRDSSGRTRRRSPRPWPGGGSRCGGG